MNNTELKELFNSIKPPKCDLDKLNNVKNTFSNVLKDNLTSKVKIAEYRIGGSFGKGTIIKERNEIDIVVVISPNIKGLNYKDLASFCMNYIENCFLINYYEKLQLISGQKVGRNYERNTLSLKTNNGVEIDFLIKFKKEQLNNKDIEDIENFYLERDNQQLKFINKANEEFPLFKNTIMLIKHFRNEFNLKCLSSYMIEILLYHSLSKYSISNHDYLGYLKAFIFGLRDFSDKKVIEVTKKMYKYLNNETNIVLNDTYQVIDVANRSNNVAKRIKANDMSEIVEFKDDLNSKLQNDKSKSQQTKNTNEKLFKCKVYLLTADKNKTYYPIIKYNNQIVKLKASPYDSTNISDITYTILKAIKRIIKKINQSNYTLELEMDEFTFNKVNNGKYSQNIIAPLKQSLNDFNKNIISDKIKIVYVKGTKFNE